MPSTLDTNVNPGALILMKGESGAGKSDAAYSFPNVYTFDFDRKMPAIARKHFPDKEIQWDTFHDIFSASEKLESLIDHCPYQTVVFDSLTALSTMSLRAVGETKNEKVLDMLQRVKQTRGGNKQIEFMSIDYYNGEYRFICDYFIDRIKVLWAKEGNPKYVILIAHVLTVESAPALNTGLITKTRSIVTAGRKVAAQVPTEFDEMWHFAKTQPEGLGTNGQQRRVCLTQGFGDDEAKTAFKFPAMIEFTDASLYDALCRADPNFSLTGSVTKSAF